MIKNIGKIFSHVFKSYKEYWFILFLLPIIIAGILVYFEVFIVKGMASNLLTALSLFTAMMFSMIFILPEKYSKRMIQYQGIIDEEVVNYLNRYKRFVENFISRIAYVTLLSVLIICSLLLITVIPCENMTCLIKLIYVCTNSIIYATGFHFIILIVLIVVSTYNMMIDDLNQKNPDMYK